MDGCCHITLDLSQGVFYFAHGMKGVDGCYNTLWQDAIHREMDALLVSRILSSGREQH
jgi:hypothetical protein